MSTKDLPVGVNWSTMMYPNQASEDQQHLLSMFRRVQTPQKQTTEVRAKRETMEGLIARVNQTYRG